MDKAKIYDIIVVGAGPAGIMAAGTAAKINREVLLLERNTSAGRKLLITGKGRCNITNIASIDEFIANFSASGKFLYNAFSQFFSEDLIRFFEQRQVAIKVERGGRVFPQTDKALSILKALFAYLNENNVSIMYGQQVKTVTKDKYGLFVIITDKQKFSSRKVIIATGGVSYPKTGSTGDGYAIAKSFGHNIIPIKPALVPLETSDTFIKELQGLSLKNVEVNVLLNNKTKITEFGEMLFTHFGLSGPIILKISREAVELLTQGEVIVSIDLKPALSCEKLDERLIREFKSHNLIYKNMLKELLPAKLIPVFIRLSAIDPAKKINQITQLERKKIITLLKSFKVKITRARPIDEAIVTSGGVDVKEVNPKTMESRKVFGLYFCGEVLDIQGNSGGYNLQAAFSTGYVAGNSAAGKP